MFRKVSFPTPPEDTVPSRGLTSPHPEDIAFAGGIFALFLLSWVASGTESLHWNGWAAVQPIGLRLTLTVITAFLMTGSLMWRRAKPLIVAVMILVGTMMHIAVFDGPNWMLVSTPLAIYSVTRWGSRRLSITTLVLASVGSLRSATSWMYPITRANAQMYVLLILLLLSMLLISYLLGRAARTNADKASSEAAAAEQAAQAEVARRRQDDHLAEARVRTEIARELHDVVAHSLSVMIVQADGGRAIACKDPDAAIKALDTISNIGRESLGEMRHLVEVLRDTGATEGEALAPHPTLDDIPAMVAQIDTCVELTVTGEPPAVPPTVHTVAYRVVQESLTNVLKHAGAKAKAWVRINYQAAAIDIDVQDDGQGDEALVAIPGDVPGHGLQGMRERLLSVGGHLDTGPSEMGGFRVHAWLPVLVDDGEPITDERRIEAMV